MTESISASKELSIWFITKYSFHNQCEGIFKRLFKRIQDIDRRYYPYGIYQARYNKLII